MGYCFCCFLELLHDSLALESDCSGYDETGKLFWVIKKLEFLLFLGDNKVFQSFYR